MTYVTESAHHQHGITSKYNNICIFYFAGTNGRMLREAKVRLQNVCRLSYQTVHTSQHTRLEVLPSP